MNIRRPRLVAAAADRFARTKNEISNLVSPAHFEGLEGLSPHSTNWQPPDITNADCRYRSQSRLASVNSLESIPSEREQHQIGLPSELAGSYIFIYCSHNGSVRRQNKETLFPSSQPASQSVRFE